jgi:hypothetical protein
MRSTSMKRPLIVIALALASLPLPGVVAAQPPARDGATAASRSAVRMHAAVGAEATWHLLAATARIGGAKCEVASGGPRVHGCLRRRRRAVGTTSRELVSSGQVSTNAVPNPGFEQAGCGAGRRDICGLMRRWSRTPRPLGGRR